MLLVHAGVFCGALLIGLQDNNCIASAKPSPPVMVPGCATDSTS